MIRLYTIEDHPVVIKGLRNLYNSSRDKIEVVGTASCVDDALTRADPDSFDIILLDLWLPNSHPILNVKKLKQHFLGKPLVIYTSEDDSSWQRKMFEAGVMAYILKNESKFTIKSVLEKVMEGQIVFSGMVVPNYEKKLTFVLSGKKYKLTTKQQELIILLSSGLTIKKIADSKKTYVSTVEKTLKHIRDKFDAKNNAELVKILLEKGII